MWLACMDVILCFGRWHAGAPNLGQLLDFLESLSDGAQQDRGKHNVRFAKSILSAVSFAAYKISTAHVADLSRQCPSESLALFREVVQVLRKKFFFYFSS